MLTANEKQLAQVRFDNEHSATADDMYNADVQTAVLVKAVPVKPTKVGKGFAINAPKPNAVAVACSNIAAIAATGKALKPNVTPLGHLANCKGGIIDATILSGNVHTIESFITALVNSGINNVKADIIKYGHTDTLQAVLAKRVVDHITWASNTLNNSHGGFVDRLKNVSLESKRAEIAANLVELAHLLQMQFKGRYATLYNNRPKN